VIVDLRADVQQYHERGRIWTVQEEPRGPSLPVEGAIVAAGDEEDPFLARVVDL
jgi:hypothetical protein